MDLFDIPFLIKTKRIVKDFSEAKYFVFTKQDTSGPKPYDVVGITKQNFLTSILTYVLENLPTSSDIEALDFAASDETSALTAGSDKVIINASYNFTLLSLFAGLSTPQTSGSIFTVDIIKNGVSVLSTQITITNGAQTSLSAVAQPVISDTSFIKGDKISVKIIQVGDGTATGLKLYLSTKRV